MASKTMACCALFLLIFLATSLPVMMRLRVLLSMRLLAGSSGSGKYCSTLRHFTCEFQKMLT